MEAKKVLLVIVMCISMACAESPTEAQQAAPNSIDGCEFIVGSFLNSKLKKFEGLTIPAIPTQRYDVQGHISIAISMSKLNLTGITDYEFDKCVIERHLFTITGADIQLVFPKITLDIGHYSSGGNVNSLPFNGEGPAQVALHKLRVGVVFNSEGKEGLAAGKYCTKSSSVQVSVDLRRLQVEFVNMNPDSDQGQLINIVLSSFGPDIIDYLQILLNNKYNKLAEDIVTDFINTSYCPGWVSNSPLNDRALMAEYMNDIYQEYLNAIETHVFSN